MVERGYFEAINYSFIDPDAGRNLLETSPGTMLANPIADNMAEMRQSLIPGLLTALSRNLNRQEPTVKLFECGNIFVGKGKKRKEWGKIAAVTCGNALPRQWGANIRPVDFFDIKGDVESLLSLTGDVKSFDFVEAEHPLLHPGRSASVLRNGKTVGQVGQLHPEKQNALDIAIPVFLFELDQSVLIHSVLPQFKEISRYPAIQRDLAVVVGQDVAAAKVLEIVNNAAGKHLKSLELFDIYTGERVEINTKSFAFSLTFQSESSSLTSADIDAVTNNIIMALQDSVGAELRT
jgi:phenylalanyl-tRNA synthetase beta chain